MKTFPLFRRAWFGVVLASFGTNLMANERAPVKIANQSAESKAFAEMPVAITSFGAARIGDAVYVYGGHTGSAHAYSNESQSNQLLKLDLDQPGAPWSVVAEGPRLQGLGLVAHGDRLIRVGGFTATNAKGEEHDLQSTDEVTAFDLSEGKWQSLPKLPEPRSSHDAAVIGDTLYVVGGWQLQSPNESTWHSTAWSLDLKQEQATWQALPEPPLARRALALAGHAGKLYVIGGMDEAGGPTKEVAIYDPATKQWSEGPAIEGEKPMAGFGAAAVELGGQLIVTTFEGKIERLTDDGQRWEVLGDTADARFFHRILPLGPGKLISIGGANMESGKFLMPEVIAIAP